MIITCDRQEKKQHQLLILCYYSEQGIHVASHTESDASIYSAF